MPGDWFVIDSAIAIASGVGVTNKALHPHAALLFYDYMLSPEAQQILAKIGYVPSNTKVESPIKGVKLKFLDASALLDDQEKSQALFESILQIKR